MRLPKKQIHIAKKEARETTQNKKTERQKRPSVVAKCFFFHQPKPIYPIQTSSFAVISSTLICTTLFVSRFSGMNRQGATVRTVVVISLLRWIQGN